MLSHSTMEVINGIKQQIISQLQKTEMLKDFKSSNENSHNWNVIRTALGKKHAFKKYDQFAV